MTRENTPRFEVLSRSDSGMHFVRERRTGVMRMLTESEIADFNDPPPCPDCGEQFGCEHLNCAGEAMLADDEVATDVPREWIALARAHGLSRNDLERLRSLEEREGEYHAAPGADLRTLELVCILNER